MDTYIADGVAEELRVRIADAREPGRITSPRWVQDFRDAMSYKGSDAVALGPIFPRDRTEKLDYRADATKFEAPPEIWVEAQPQVPAALLEAARSGTSNVAPAQALAAAPPTGDTGDPGDSRTADAPVQPVADQTGRDIIWITQMYRIPTAAIAAAFRDVKIPVELFKTTVLEITLERQEVLPDGSYGPTKVIRPLPTVALQPMPPPNASVAVKTGFLQWANANPRDILQPPFYTVLAGDAWSAPGQEATTIAPTPDQPKGGEPFDPSKYVDATHSQLMELTPEQRQAVAAYKKKKADEERKSKASGKSGGKSGLGGGGGTGGKGGGPFGPDDGDRGAAGQGGGFIDPGSLDGGPRNPEERGPNAPDLPAPPGEFDPREIADGILGWAHDDTVEAGKTYRYRITYKIKSPVWNTPNVTKPADLANTFDLVSVPSEWGTPVSVPSLTSFFVLRSVLGGNAATVQVFRWHGGAIKMKNFDVSPGDSIGTRDGEVDFNTGWTMVDMRSDPRSDDRLVVLMDPSGRIHTRDFRTDNANPERKKKEAEAASASAGAGATDTVAGTR